MPSIAHSFSLHSPQTTVWDFLTDFEKLGPQLPHVESVKYTEASKESSKWILKGSMGPVTKRFNIVVKNKEETVPNFFSFEGEGDGLKLKGRVETEKVNDTDTKISFKLDIDASGGIVGAIVNHMIESQLPADIKNSEAGIRKLLEG